MAKKPVKPEKSRSKNNSKIHNKDNGIRSNNSKTPITKNENGNRNKISKISNDDTSSEETEVLVGPSSSTETQNDNVVDSSEAEEDGGVDHRSPSDDDEKEKKKAPKNTEKNGKKVELKNKGKKRIKKEEEYEEEAEEKMPKTKNKKVEVKNKGKKRSKKEEYEEEEAEEKSENAVYRFPINRVKSIIKNEIPDLRITSEALFLINIASEKFLQLFCREAYACAFLDRKSYIAYNHLSSVVSKRKRLEFLSDFVPEKVKANDALAQIGEAEK